MTDSPSPTANTDGHLLGHLLRFGRLLRLMGVQVSLRQVLDLVEATGYVPITAQVDFYSMARALLLTRREDFPVFDQAFALFWRSIQAGDAPRGSGRTGGAGKRLRLPGQPGSGALGEDESEVGEAGSDGSGIEKSSFALRITRYSPREVLRHKDFKEMSWEEVRAAKRAIAELDWKLGERRTRRYHPAYKGRLDLRRMVRDNLGNGGEYLALAHRMHTRRLRPLVVLCDVSGSMERYSRMLLHFIHALTHGLTGIDVEAFVFSTRLTRITHYLRHKDVDESLDRLGKAVNDWSGGTRIGEAIKNFNYHWARRTLGRGAVVLIISDGWDRGNVDLLARETARLQRSAYRLVWLNPLIGTTGYEPNQRGMASVLPFVDDLLPGRNLAGLEELAGILSSVTLRRPERKQQPHRSPAEPAEASSVRRGPRNIILRPTPWRNDLDDQGRLRQE